MRPCGRRSPHLLPDRLLPHAPGCLFRRGSKKGTVTETTTEQGGGSPVYNITFPDPNFPTFEMNPATIYREFMADYGGSGGTTKKGRQTVKEIAIGVKDPPAPRIVSSETKKQASAEITGRRPDTGIDILNKIAWR